MKAEAVKERIARELAGFLISERAAPLRAEIKVIYPGTEARIVIDGEKLEDKA